MQLFEIKLELSLANYLHAQNLYFVYGIDS